MTGTDPPLLTVRDLRLDYPVRRGGLGHRNGTLRAVAGVSFTLRAGETLGLVGESGCGKSSVAHCVTRAIRPTAGAIVYQGPDGPVDLATLPERSLRPYRQQIRMVFQDPYAALNPRLTLLRLVGEPLRVSGQASGSELVDRVAAMLRRVGLRPEDMRRYPRAFSGGERQRISIARALITRPRLVVADEPVSALDVSVRAQILNLMCDLRDELGLTYLFISHDLSVVDHLCERVLVMYLGSTMEHGPTDGVFARPRHPYTEALLSAVPVADPRLRRRANRIRLADDLPDPVHPPSGCVFRTRCGHARARCGGEVPPLAPVGAGLSACLFADTLTLAGGTRLTRDGCTDVAVPIVLTRPPAGA